MIPIWYLYINLSIYTQSYMSYIIMIMIDISITFRETNSNGSENHCLGPMKCPKLGPGRFSQPKC